MLICVSTVSAYTPPGGVGVGSPLPPCPPASNNSGFARRLRPAPVIYKSSHPKLFAKLAFIGAGRALWSWLAGFSKDAASSQPTCLYGLPTGFPGHCLVGIAIAGKA